mmetsp:Transcript_13750/g.20007  ORF Transcript_13750/g.20007 Transcript_13750/m.20007 type:complete len:286 (-) Transcript_13750:10-867(-)
MVHRWSNFVKISLMPANKSLAARFEAICVNPCTSAMSMHTRGNDSANTSPPPVGTSMCACDTIEPSSDDTREKSPPATPATPASPATPAKPASPAAPSVCNMRGRDLRKELSLATNPTLVSNPLVVSLCVFVCVCASVCVCVSGCVWASGCVCVSGGVSVYVFVWVSGCGVVAVIREDVDDMATARHLTEFRGNSAAVDSAVGRDAKDDVCAAAGCGCSAVVRGAGWDMCGYMWCCCRCCCAMCTDKTCGGMRVALTDSICDFIAAAFMRSASCLRSRRSCSHTL